MQREKVNIDEKLLTQIADETGGQYFRAKDNEGLKKYTEIDRLEKSKIEITALKGIAKNFSLCNCCGDIVVAGVGAEVYDVQKIPMTICKMITRIDL
jgi:hypothetical protein